MVQREVIVQIPGGITDKAAVEIVRCATQFQCKLFLCRNDCEISAKSLLGILSMKIQEGDRIVLSAEGPDELEAAEQLARCISHNQ